MLIHIQLRDQDNIIHASHSFEVESETSMTELQSLIELRFHCQSSHQRLSHQDEVMIDPSMTTVEEASIVADETLNLGEHEHLGVWLMYKSWVRANHFHEDDDRRETARHVASLYKILKKSNFFLVYEKFCEFRDEHHKKIASYLDKTFVMKKNARLYFKSLFSSDGSDSDPSVRCRFKKPPKSMEGSHDNLLVSVHDPVNNKDHKYLIKNSSYGPIFYIRREYGVDIQKVFLLKVLEKTGHGPKVHFIPSKVSDELYYDFRCLYYASEFRPDYRRISDMHEVDPEVAIQIFLLKELLFLTELDSMSCGAWKNTSTAAIVDFSTREPEWRDVFSNTQRPRSNSQWMKHFEDMRELRESHFYSRVEYYINLWDLDTVIDKVFEETETLKAVFEQHNTTFRSKYYSDMCEYCVEAIHENLELLRTKLEENKIEG